MADNPTPSDDEVREILRGHYELTPSGEPWHDTYAHMSAAAALGFDLYETDPATCWCSNGGAPVAASFDSEGGM